VNSSDLAFYTTRELIAELVRRRTFLGLVVHAETEFKEKAWRGERIFNVHLNSNLDAGQARRLLTQISEHMDQAGV
jgi:hypothetical protein